MKQDIVDLLAEDERDIRDDGFSARVETAVRRARMRRGLILSAAGMTGLGMAAGGLLEFAERGMPTGKTDFAWPESLRLGEAPASEITSTLSAMPPVDLALWVAAGLVMAAWIWQVVAPQSAD